LTVGDAVFVKPKARLSQKPDIFAITNGSITLNFSAMKMRSSTNDTTVVCFYSILCGIKHTVGSM